MEIDWSDVVVPKPPVVFSIKLSEEEAKTLLKYCGSMNHAVVEFRLGDKGRMIYDLEDLLRDALTDSGRI